MFLVLLCILVYLNGKESVRRSAIITFEEPFFKLKVTVRSIRFCIFLFTCFVQIFYSLGRLHDALQQRCRTHFQ